MEEKEINNPAPEETVENGAENAPEVENEPLSELDQTKADLVEQKDKYLRLMAEFDNFKRRTAKERMELIQTAGKDVIVSLLDVLDDCDRAEKQLNTTDDVAVQKEDQTGRGPPRTMTWGPPCPPRLDPQNRRRSARWRCPETRGRWCATETRTR